MAKMHSSCYAVCLLASMIVNILLMTQQYKVRNQLTWSQNAAAEAESVASISCSGNGRAYVDGLVVDGKPVCECNSCFQGPDCSQFITDCPADADRFGLAIPLKSPSPLLPVAKFFFFFFYIFFFWSWDL